MESVAFSLLGIWGLLADGRDCLESNGRIPMTIPTSLLTFQAYIPSFDLRTWRSGNVSGVVDPRSNAALTFDMSISTAPAAVAAGQMLAKATSYRYEH